MERPVLGTTGRMAADDPGAHSTSGCWPSIGEGRGRLDIASTCSVCGALNDESGPATPGERVAPW